jgi:endonuclease/exonuclease/phosphatase family metal-dependent hydrolase
MPLPRQFAVLLLIVCAALALSSACGSDEQGPTIVVINQNILHGFLDEDPEADDNDRIDERIEIMAEALAEERPDIITLQEVLTQFEAPYPDVRTILMDAMGPEYTAVFGSLTGEPIDTVGLGQLTITRLPIVSSENFKVGGVRAVHRVTVQTDDGPVDIYNAHLEGTDDDDPQFAVDEIAKVIDFIEDTRSGGPVILAGDFNATPDDPSIRTLIEAGFVDVLDKAGDATCAEAGDPGCTSDNVPLADPALKASRRIDFIFVLPGEDVRLEPRDAERFHDFAADIGGGESLWASDHIGVLGVFEVKQ